MPPKLTQREWIEKYKTVIQDEKILHFIDRQDLKRTQLGLR
jgi:hypothetical protein